MADARGPDSDRWAALGERLRGALQNLVVVTVPAALVCLFLVEIFFRVVIPAAEVPVRLFDPADGIVRFDPAGPREGRFTRGRLAEVRARWRINEQGWNSEIDYLPRSERGPTPLIAVVGDSYLNGFQVDPEENLASVLRRELQGGFEVYRFGTPGAPLSQYLQMSRYVNRHFDPQILVFVVVHNDFHQSLRELGAQPSYLQLAREGGKLVEVPPSDTKPPGHPAWMRSALLRYLKITLQSYLLAGAAPTASPTTRYIANIPVDVVDANRELIREATFLLVGKIRQENPHRTLIFMMDAPRTDLYSGALEQSGVRWLNDLLEEACGAQGVAFVDLRERFSQVFRETGQHFESSVDAHWNELGHREAARALHQELVELGLAPPS